VSNDRGGRAATVVGAGILISRLTGLFRNFLLAHFFGLSVEADAYNAASKIPNIMRTLLGEGALSASFVPVYSRLLEKGDERAANALAGAILGLLMAAISVLTLVGIAAAPLLTSVLTPAFSGAQRDLTITLTRIMFPMTALMVMSGWCLGVQNSHRRFFWSYASAAMWNVAQIVLLVGWGARASSQVQLAVWLAWATLAGSVLQVTAQLPEVLSLVRPLRVTFNRAAEGVRETLGNVVPVVTALGVVQLSSLIDLQIANYLPAGAITSLTNANVVVLLPVALFGVSVAASSLPEFSRDTSGVDMSALLERLRGGWQRILFYIVPSAIACIVYGDLIVGLLYRSGKFGAREQQLVHAVLAAFAVGLVSFGSVKLLASAHYALKDYRTPLRASISSLVVSAVISIAFAWPLRHSAYGAAGIALGTAIGSYVNLSVQTRALRARLGALYTCAMWHGTRRIAFATVTAALVAAPVRYLLRSERPLLAGPPTLVAFGMVYLVTAWWMGSGEAARWLRQPQRLQAPVS
jgi:putative peptidoglycan lipid II flippase